MRFLCKVPFYVKVPTFLVTTALQHCFKSSCRAPSAGGAHGARALPMRRPWRFSAYDRFTVLLAVPFSFPVLRLEISFHGVNEAGLKMVRFG